MTEIGGVYLYLSLITSLPESIGYLTHLTHFDVSDNQMTRLPDSIGDLDYLEYLNVGTNQLTALPNSIKRLQSLGTLCVIENPITSTKKKQDEVLRRFERDGLEITVESPNR